MTYEDAIETIQDMLDVMEATGSCYVYKHNGGDIRLKNVLECLRAQQKLESSLKALESNEPPTLAELRDDGMYSKRKARERLKEYEDTGLEPEIVVLLKHIVEDAFGDKPDFVDHIRDLLQAEKDGRDAQELYRLALTTWGPDAQTIMMFEEMSELQKELCKHARGKDNREAIADEIADVLIMLEQMMILHDCGQDVKEHKAAKLKRLASRLPHEEAEAALQKGGE